MNKLYVGLIGLGKMGKKWVEVIERSDMVECVAYIEQDKELLTEFANEKKIQTSKLFQNLQSALQVIEMDFIIDATPPTCREYASLIALKNNIHVLCEKPVSDNLVVAEKMQRICKEKNLICMVSQDYRFNSMPMSILNYLESGIIGELSFIEITFHRDTYFERENFRVQMEYPMILDMSVHHLDLLRFFLKRETNKIETYAFKSKSSSFVGNDSHVMYLDYDDVKVSYTASWSSKGIQTPRSGIWRFDGSEGSLLWCGNLLLYIKEKNKQMNFMPLSYENFALSAQDYVLNEFVQAVLDNQIPPCNIDDNIKTMKMCFEAIDSAKRLRTSID